MIRDQKAFREDWSFYKGNLHSHTTNSDGKLTPAQAAELYREHGYSFLCFSEHDYFTDLSGELDREDFLILPGLEASAILMDQKGEGRLKVHHIHGILGTEVMRRQAGDRVFRDAERVAPMVYRGSWDGAAVAQRLTDHLRSRGCITMYNHPVWSRVEAGEFMDTKGLWALEVFNYDTVNESNTGYDPVSWDLMLRKGIRIWGTATDDNHNEGLFPDSCGGYIMVCAPSLDREAILENMLAGNFYSSAGPEITRWEVKDGRAIVECSDVYRIDFFAGNRINDGTTILAAEHESCVNRGEYVLKGHEEYVRVQCTDKYGRTAWSNPFFA